MRDRVELLIDTADLSQKARRMLQAMAESAPAGTRVVNRYTGRGHLLMLYGPGSATKLPIVREHVRRGGHVAMWDMGYWERRDAMRLSIDDLHPTVGQMNAVPADAPARREFKLREDGDPDGHIVLVGLGPKSVFAYGLGEPLEWERRKAAELQKRFPGRTIVWRPKGGIAQPLGDMQMRHQEPFAELLRGAALVVSHHSNASVDSATAGVPFETEQGAALWLQRREFTPANRLDFLRRLSWWEWSRFEAPAAWDWILRMTADRVLIDDRLQALPVPRPMEELTEGWIEP